MRKTRFTTRLFSVLMAALLTVGTIGYSVNAEETSNSQTEGTEATTALKEEKTEATTETTTEEKTEATTETTTEEKTEATTETVTEEKTEAVTETTTEAKRVMKRNAAAPANSTGSTDSSAGSSESSTGESGSTTPDTGKVDLNSDKIEVKFKEADKKYVYTGSAITPEIVVTEKVKDAQGKEEIVTLTKDKEYTVKYESNVDSAAKSQTSAKVIVEAKDTAKYTGTKSLDFNIEQKDISDYDMKMEDKDKVYRGTEINADVNLYHGKKKLTRATDYRVQDYTNNLNVGTASAKVTGIGNYKGERMTYFKIAAKNINELAISPNFEELTYKWDGKYKTPKVTLTFDATGKKGVFVERRTLQQGVDYDVVYEDNKKVGTAGVMIVGKGNFGGSRVETFKIRPEKTRLRKLEKGRKMVKATWVEKTKQVTGYVVQISTKKDFSSSVKKYKVKKKITSKTFKGLKSRKKYFVRVRTYKNVSGINYYSGWSNVMKIKTR